MSSGEADEAIHQLLALGQEKGHLLCDEIAAVLPAQHPRCVCRGHRLPPQARYSTVQMQAQPFPLPHTFSFVGIGRLSLNGQ